MRRCSTRRTGSADTRDRVRPASADNREQGRAATVCRCATARRGPGPWRLCLAGRRCPARRGSPAQPRRCDAVRCCQAGLGGPVHRRQAGRGRSRERTGGGRPAWCRPAGAAGPAQRPPCGRDQNSRPGRDPRGQSGPCWHACHSRHLKRRTASGPVSGCRSRRSARHRTRPGRAPWRGQAFALRAGSAAPARAGQSSGRPDNPCRERIVLRAAGWDVVSFPWSTWRRRCHKMAAAPLWNGSAAAGPGPIP